MCGIAGKIDLAGNLDSAIHKMVEHLGHRGPDSEGFFVNKGIEFGMCRLALIDVSSGQQPVFDETERFVLVFNGEIYNFRELTRLLKDKGHKFKSKGDAEVLVHLFEEFGKDLVHHIRGMYAIAVYDLQNSKLTLITDRFGKKPILWAEPKSGQFIFASEFKSLSKGLPDSFSIDPNLTAILQVFELGYISAPQTAYEGIYSLPPASILEWSSQGLQVYQYWNPVFQENLNYSESQWKDQVKLKIEEAVKIRLISERPIGSFLSGGIDSSIVSAVMQQHSANQIQTFTIGFEDARFDESHWAREISKVIGSNHNELIVKPDPVVLLNTIANTFDQPFADSSAIPTFLVSQLASRNVVAILSGDGGDEIFGGYDRYRYSQKLRRSIYFNSFLSKLMKIPIPMGGLDPKFQSIKRILLNSNSRESIYRNFMTLYSNDDLNLLLNDNIFRSSFMNTGRSKFEVDWKMIAGNEKNFLNQMQLYDQLRYLPGDLLVKVDMTSMANSLEVRSPFLDRELVDLVLQLPSSLRIRKIAGKYILKQIAFDLLPRQLLERPKMGFAIPRADWLRGPLAPIMNNLLLSRQSISRDWYNIDAVKQIIKRHNSGENLDHLLWPMLMVELWAQSWLDKGRPN